MTTTVYVNGNYHLDGIAWDVERIAAFMGLQLKLSVGGFNLALSDLAHSDSLANALPVLLLLLHDASDAFVDEVFRLTSHRTTRVWWRLRVCALRHSLGSMSDRL